MLEAKVFSSELLPQSDLDKINVPQCRNENREFLDTLGGVKGLMQKLKTSPTTGLSAVQVEEMRERYGTNAFPESPMAGFFELFIAAFNDTTLMILIAAAIVSLVIGIVIEGGEGWIEGTAILVAVFLVAGVTAGNDYTKELQFRSLEASSQSDERCSVIREGLIERINPKELCVGDLILLQAGDAIPADSIICDHNVIKANESALTGEPDDLPKKLDDDCFLLSSCLVTEGEESHAIVIGVGPNSQWGKIKANLVTEAVNTPLQDKLEIMAAYIGYLGLFAALGTFIAMVISIWARHHGEDVLGGFIEAFILAVTIVVVAIPEGLPLAVTIALAYSTKKMYQDQCFIRVLAACETMGNATNICSDKTGTLTENKMTVVQGYFVNEKIDQDSFEKYKPKGEAADFIVENVSINRVAYLVYKDADGKPLHKPAVIGSKTEGALIIMAQNWDCDAEAVKKLKYSDDRDKLFSFNSSKKRSTAVIHKEDGVARLLCKGAPEWVLRDCTHYSTPDGGVHPLDEKTRADIEGHIVEMANNALRTLCLAHRDFQKGTLPENWKDDVPDHENLCVDCIVGIIDPLRGDVKEAVKTAQQAGVTVRMVTGDNIATAKAIAKQCGILTENGMAIEGPVFRDMAPKDVDKILPKLQVMARSSPDDKYLLVTRLNGYAIPDGPTEWAAKHAEKENVSWEKDKDRLMPGYLEEWKASRPEGGEVVGVTGDGTNDAPALKAADVGLSMGITGTKVAQSASDIVILDDKFSSIVNAIMWGRSVYDNIRKFLQFQLTVNVVALIVVFIGACAGFEPPLNAVMMLWINLVMDTLGALALATEEPSRVVLTRRPYKRQANLLSWPMMRNIGVQSIFQLVLLLILMFSGANMFNIHEGAFCEDWKVDTGNSQKWDSDTQDKDANGSITCSSLNDDCDKSKNGECYDDYFKDFEDFEEECLEDCKHFDYTHGTILFNTFVFCQIFNEYNSKSIHSDPDVYSTIPNNYIFMGVSVITVGLQIILVEFGGEFVKTSHLNLMQWIYTILLGLISLPVGVLMRYIPFYVPGKGIYRDEDPNSFFSEPAL